MNQQDFINKMQELHGRCVDISKRKNKDYSSQDNPFQNFMAIEALTNGAISTEFGIVTRMGDKLVRILNVTRNGENAVKDESLTDTGLDLSNYACIFVAFIDWKKTLSETEYQQILSQVKSEIMLSAQHGDESALKMLEYADSYNQRG